MLEPPGVDVLAVTERLSLRLAAESLVEVFVLCVQVVESASARTHSLARLVKRMLKARDGKLGSARRESAPKQSQAGRLQRFARRAVLSREQATVLAETLRVGLAETASKSTGTAAETPTPDGAGDEPLVQACLLYTSPSPRDKRQSRMPSSA